MKTDEKQIRHGVALLAVIILILAITGGYMAIDCYLVGDEVVTYGMAMTDGVYLFLVPALAPLVRVLSST